MNRLPQSHRMKSGRMLALLVSSTVVAQAVAATSALQPEVPSAFQQAPSAFGTTAGRTDSVAAAKKPEPLALKPSTSLGTRAEPAAAPAKAAVAPKNNASPSGKSVSGLEDRAIIIVSGRPAEAKRKLNADAAAKAALPMTRIDSARALRVKAPDATVAATANAVGARAPVLLTDKAAAQSK